jgi:hypothetical protein
MPRKRLEPGDHGKVRVDRRADKTDGTPLWEARARIRLSDGSVYRPTAYGPTELAARRRMFKRLREIAAERAAEPLGPGVQPQQAQAAAMPEAQLVGAPAGGDYAGIEDLGPEYD